MELASIDPPSTGKVGQPIGSYTVAMVAARWGVSGTMVYEQVKAGRLRSFKLGNKLIRIKPEWLDEYEEAASLSAEPIELPSPATPNIRKITRLARRGRG